MTQQEIQDLILSTSVDCANQIEEIRVLMVGGVPLDKIEWQPVKMYELLIKAMQRQFDLEDYDSDETVAVYECLVEKLGYNTDVITVDPDYDPNDTNITIVNPASYQEPLEIPWEDMSPDGSPDGDITRITFIKAEWAGIRPFLSLIEPSETGLAYPGDFTLIPTGGFVLRLDGNVPGLVEGQKLWAIAFKKA